MAKRQIRLSTDEVLRKTCKPVKEITANTLTLLEDMAETMYDANGVGLAAPQVGILKRIEKEFSMSTVSVRKIADQSYESIKATVDQVIADVGGLEDIIKQALKKMMKG